MPTLEHEFPLDLVRHFPDLAALLLGHAADIPVPEFDHARCDASEATTTAPPELRADSVIVLEGKEDGKEVPVQAIVIECQTGHDADKRFTWPVYVTNVRARLRCPVVLLVLTPTASLASWCAEPIDAGGGYLTHRPLALALDTLRPVTDIAEARDQPAITILAAFAHYDRDLSVLDAVPAALNALDPENGSLYADYMLAALPAAARKYLEEQVKLSDHKYKSELIGGAYQEGRAATLLDVLEARGIDVDADGRARIMACSDEDRLDTWVRRALTVSSTEELFA